MRIASAILLTALLASPLAYAQSNPPASDSHVTAAGKWRASKVIGVDVYNNNNEKVGDISELIIDSSGRVDRAILSVGGFLGMGEHLVAVPLGDLKFAHDAGKSTTGSSASSSKDWYPERVTLNASKDQLKAMPEFKY